MTNDEVLLSEDPYEDIPRDLAAGLEEFLLPPNDETASERLSAFIGLLDMCADSEGKTLRSLADRLKHGEVWLGRGEDGLFSEDGMEDRVCFPSWFVSTFVQYVLEASADEMTRRFWSIHELVHQWEGLVLDDEKLAGHLLRSHALTDITQLCAEGEPMFALHSRLHADDR